MSATATLAQPRTAARLLLDKARQAHLDAVRRAAESGMSRTELLTDLDAFACAADQIVALSE